MKKQQVIALVSNQDELERVEAVYRTAERLKKDGCAFDALNTEEEVKAFIKSLTASYAKRKEKALANPKSDKRSENAAILKAVKKARAEKVSVEEIISTIEKLYKEKHNAKLEAKIAELKSQLI